MVQSLHNKKLQWGKRELNNISDPETELWRMLQFSNFSDKKTLPVSLGGKCQDPHT